MTRSPNPQSFRRSARDAPSFAFTLIELLVVISIISIPIGVMLPKIQEVQVAAFRVLKARNGLEALEILQSHGPQIDAAVLDNTMPGMIGLEVVAALRRDRPNLPTGHISGHSHPDLSSTLAAIGSEFVQAPFSLASLR